MRTGGALPAGTAVWRGAAQIFPTSLRHSLIHSAAVNSFTQHRALLTFTQSHAANNISASPDQHLSHLAITTLPQKQYFHLFAVCHFYLCSKCKHFTEYIHVTVNLTEKKCVFPGELNYYFRPLRPHRHRRVLLRQLHLALQ